MGDRATARDGGLQNLDAPGGRAWRRHAPTAFLATAAFAVGAAGFVASAALPLRDDVPRAYPVRASDAVSAQQAAATPPRRVFDWLPDEPTVEIIPEAPPAASRLARASSEAVGEALQPSETQRARLAPSSPTTTEGIQPAPPASPLNPTPESALGYAALEEPGPVPAAPEIRLSPSPSPDPAPSAGVAVYDISASTVYMPNGEKLEAHSGLRDKLDDPRYVHVRMRGATPPGVYDLREREKRFHGVRALRLNPVGGSAAVHGRTGLLAHTYMLGPKGDSNGCLVFKNYDRFLQAYLKGEVKRLVVVAGRDQDGPAGRDRMATPGRSGPSPSDG